MFEEEKTFGWNSILAVVRQVKQVTKLLTFGRDGKRKVYI